MEFSMEFSTIGFSFTSLLNFAISVKLYTASEEASLFYPLFFPLCRYTDSNLECFLICILNLNRSPNALIYFLFMMCKS